MWLVFQRERELSYKLPPTLCRSPAGAAAMDKLLGSADIFATNLRVTALDRLGLG